MYGKNPVRKGLVSVARAWSWQAEILALSLE
jgi:hypothetical protein